MSKERPILFSVPMVRAILEGRKTQTRRVVKHPDGYFDEKNWPIWSDEYGDWHRRTCPYGKPGDRLWVRETWAVEERLDKIAPSKFHRWPTWFAADGAYLADSPGRGFHTGNPRGRWRPSIHMPRWASRITLEIVDVRVERLMDISRDDAIAEGIERKESTRWEGKSVFRDYLAEDPLDPEEGEWYERPQASFRSLWESINGVESLHGNPLVWVVEFRKLP